MDRASTSTKRYKNTYKNANSTKGIYWCFTLNNPDLCESLHLVSLVPSVDNHIQYLVFQKEKGESGTEHYQGYIEFTQQVRISHIKKVFNTKRVHLELRKGSQTQAIIYCTKDDTRIAPPVYIGTPTIDKRKNNGRRKTGSGTFVCDVCGKTDLIKWRCSYNPSRGEQYSELIGAVKYCIGCLFRAKIRSQSQRQRRL